MKRYSTPQKYIAFVSSCVLIFILTGQHADAARRSNVLPIALFASGMSLQFGSSFLKASSQNHYDSYLNAAIQSDIQTHKDAFRTRRNAGTIMSRVGLGFVGLAVLFSIYNQLDTPEVVEDGASSAENWKTDIGIPLTPSERYQQPPPRKHECVTAEDPVPVASALRFPNSARESQPSAPFLIAIGKEVFSKSIEIKSPIITVNHMNHKNHSPDFFGRRPTSQIMVVLSLPVLLALVSLHACTSNEDFANPLDPENLRTSGAPDGLTLYAGDQQVRVTWNDTGQAGIKAYRIYRRSTGGADTEFQQVGSVDAPANEFTDTQNLENDRRDASGRLLAYEYRISYVDANGVETPAPANPPAETEDPRRIWKTALATPSVPPPAPNVTLGDPTDLTIKLFWDGYEFPYDFSIFPRLRCTRHRR